MVRANAEFLDVYKYCAKALHNTYELNIVDYSYELYLSYLSAKKTYDDTREPKVSLPLWVMWYLKGRIKDTRISEAKKSRCPPVIPIKQEDHTEIKDLLVKYDGGLLYDYYIHGATLKDIADKEGASLSTIHKLKTRIIERVKMNVDLSDYYDAIVCSKAPYLLLVKATGTLLRHIIDVKSTKYMDGKDFITDIKRVMFYTISILKYYKTPIDIIHTQTADMLEDVLYIVCHANKIVEGNDKNSTCFALYNIVGCLDSIAKRMGTSLKELAK